MKRKIVAGREKQTYQEGAALNPVRNDGAWPRAGATKEGGGKNGDIYHTQVYHTNLVPNVDQNGSTCTATTTYGNMVSFPEHQVPLENHCFETSQDQVGISYINV